MRARLLAGAPADADRRRRRRQDPPGAGGGARGAGRVPRRRLAGRAGAAGRPGAGARRRWPRRWACARSRAGRSCTDAVAAHLAPRALLLLDNCEHLLDACAALADALLRRCPRRARPGDQPRGARHRRARWPGACPRCRCPTRERTATAGRPCASTRRCASSSSARGSCARTSRLTDQNAPAVAQVCRRLDGIPLAHRAGGGAGAVADGRADRRAAGRPLPPADRRQPHRAAAPADAARADRLELRPADASRSGVAAAAAGGLRRRLDARGGRGGLRRRRRRGTTRCWTC